MYNAFLRRISVPERSRRTLALTILFLLLSSCSHFPQGSLQKTGTKGWDIQTIVIGSGPERYHSSGDVTLWIDNEKYKGRVNGNFELFHAENQWRMDITGPFNVAVATLIVDGSKTAIYAEGKWMYEPWEKITTSLFGSHFPPVIFDVLSGAKVTLNGKCRENVCTADGIYFLFSKKREKLLEIAVGELLGVYKDGSWFFSRGDKKALLFKRKTIEPLINNDKTLFQSGDVKDDLDDL